MKIIRLAIANVKRIAAVEITSIGDVVKITGRNGQGKSSVLDAIEMALAGKAAVCDQPLRRGASEGEVVVEFDDLIVTRTFADDGRTALRVTSRDGVPQKSPQAMLDALVTSQLAFDPLEFCRMAPKDQATMLRELAGLDFADLDNEREALYHQRRDLNRQHDQLAAQAKAIPAESGLPDEPVSVSELLKQRQAAADQVRHNDELRGRMERAEERLAEIDRQIAALQEERAKLAPSIEAARPKIEALEDPDLDAIDQQIASAEQTNERVRRQQKRRELVAEVERLARSSKERTERIQAIDEEKQARIAAANLPVDDLGFDDGGVTLGGLPFAQASQAEKIRTAVGIVAASRSKLRIALVRDGSLCDSDTLALLAEACAAHGLQLWLETVSEGVGDREGFVIEDGMVRAGAPA